MIDLEPFLGFFVATIIGLVLSLSTFFFVKKSGLTDYQAKLIQTLQDNASALSSRVDLLEAEVTELRKIRDSLQTEVLKLHDAIADLASENADLRKQVTGRVRLRKDAAI